MRAYLGLGSNLGERWTNIEEAVRRLNETEGLRVTKLSSTYETEPVGGPEQPDFVNAACEIETELPARELIEAVRRIEDAMGRRRTVRLGPRIIDIDILLYADSVIREPGLTVPHPLMTEREFVLRPLAEIAPSVVHPVTKRDISVLLSAVQAKSCDKTGHGNGKNGQKAP